MDQHEADRHASVYVISANSLAASYIRHVLSARYVAQTIGYNADRLSLTERTSPCLFVIDNCHLGVVAVEVVRRLTERFARSCYIVIAHRRSDIDLSLLVSFGVHGVVPDTHVETSLLQAADTVVGGGIWVPQNLLRDRCFRPKRGTHVSTLTPREQQVLDLIGQRLSNKEIGALLRIRECTVKYHVGNLFNKLSVTNRVALATTTVSAALSGL